MTDKFKILIVSLGLPLIISALGYFSFLYITGPSFEGLQNAIAEKSILSAKALIDERKVNLIKTTEDWSEWTELYDAAKRNDSGFVANSLGIANMDNLGIDLAVIISENGEIVFSTSRGLTGTEAIDIPLGFLKKILTTANNPKANSGIFEADGQNPTIFAVSPIVKSDGSGPASGKIFFGKSIDDRLMNKISEEILHPAIVLQEEDLKETGQFEDVINGLKLSNIYIQNKQDEVNLAYLNLPTSEGKNLILKVNSVADILIHKNYLYATLIYILILISLLSGILVSLFAYLSINGKIELLLASLKKFPVDFSEIFATPGSSLDELVKGAKDAIERVKKSTDSGRYLSAIVDIAHDAIVITDISGNIQSWNRSAEKMLGYTSDFVIGKNILSLVLPERRDVAAAVIKDRLLKGEGILNYEGILVSSEKKNINVQINASTVNDDSGNMLAIVNIIRDITEKKQIQEAEKDAKLISDRETKAVEVEDKPEKHDE